MRQPTLPTVIRLSSIATLASASLALSGCDDATPPPGASIGSGPADVAEPEMPLPGEQRTILAFGDSLFAGYNVPKDDSYPAQLERALRGERINARVVNAGVSGDTSAAGLQRFEFTLGAQEEKPDLLILELGGNDLLRGIEPQQTRANLAAMIEMAQAREIPVLLLGMQAPPNVGPEYQGDFNDIYSSLAQEYDVAVVLNWIEEVAKQPELIQSDRVHPTVEGITLLVKGTKDAVESVLPKDDLL